MAETSSKEWVNFFKESGLPNTAATKYAVIFSNHRIQLNMLKDLTKEILYDMGIKTMGDVIAILRHAKDVDEETTKAEILGSETHTAKTSRNSAANEPRVVTTTAAGGVKRRLTDDSTQREKVRKTLAPREPDSDGYRYMSEASTYVIKMPSILPQKVGDSVFKRLGASQEAPVKQPVVQSNSSVFSRLGSSQPIRVLSSSSSSSANSILRGAEGASSRLFASSLPIKATATVKPTNILVRKSLADATGKTGTFNRQTAGSQRVLNTNRSLQTSPRTGTQQSANASIGVKKRLGLKTGSSLTTTNAAKTLVVTKAREVNRNRLSLKKSIFDRLGPVKL